MRPSESRLVNKRQTLTFPNALWLLWGQMNRRVSRQLCAPRTARALLGHRALESSHPGRNDFPPLLQAERASRLHVQNTCQGAYSPPIGDLALARTPYKGVNFLFTKLGFCARLPLASQSNTPCGSARHSSRQGRAPTTFPQVKLTLLLMLLLLLLLLHLVVI